MTAIIYSDCFATSDNRRFKLEARSPHNGTITHRDGRLPSDDEFGFKYREHQSEFCYQLFDNTSPALSCKLWDRWQKEKEDSPGELVVGDNGWCVIRTHGFKPQLIFINPKGRDILCVRVVSSDADAETNQNCSAWALKHLSFTTAGIYWSSNSWRYFFEFEGRQFFVWRTSWGQRLVVDLSHAVVIPENGLEEVIRENEKQRVRLLLERLSSRMHEVRRLLTSKAKAYSLSDEELLEQVREASAALHLVGLHRMKDCIGCLREWESIDWPSSSRGSHAVDCWVESQSLRPIIHQSLKLLGEVPLGYPTYRFEILVGKNDLESLPLPDRLTDRSERLLTVTKAMPPEAVLALVGSPDFIRSQSRKVGEFYRWTEEWEYDSLTVGGWVTRRVTWGEDRSGKMTEIQDIAPYWLDSDEREEVYLDW